MYEEYRRMMTDLPKIVSRDTHYAVGVLICGGYTNANDTVFIEKAAKESDWDVIFTGSIASLLSTGEHSKRVINWFASRGIKA